MSTTLGGITLPDPLFDYSGYEKAVHDIGAAHEMADGRLIYDYVGSREAYILRWVGLTATQRNTCRARYDVKTVQAFSPPDDAGAVNVLVVPSSWREAYIESGGTLYYRVEFALEKQQAS